MLETVIKKAKGDEEKKIGVSLKMTESFKNKLQITADENNVSLNALIIAMLETVYEEKECAYSLNEKYMKLAEQIRYYDELIEKGAPEDILAFDPYLARKIAIAERNKIEFEIDEMID